MLGRWDDEPHVISGTFDGEPSWQADWPAELSAQSEVSRYYIAELRGRPIGAMLIIDPHLEPTHYWGDVEPDLRAIDIWIGDANDLGKGYGESMMRIALGLCFSASAVTAIIIDPLTSNVRAHRFYQRLGFEPVGRQLLPGDSDCLVHRLTRDAWRARFPEDAAAMAMRTDHGTGEVRQ